MRADLSGAGEQDLEATLQGLAALRAGLPEIDGIVLARDASEQLERRGDIRADDGAASGAS